MLADTPSLGLALGTPIAALFVLAGLFVAFVAWNARESEYRDGWRMGVACGIGGALLAIVIYLFCMWPLKHDYHFWVPVQGKVEKISSRLVSAGDKGGSNQRFVVVIKGQPYGVDDTRAALLSVGDTVNLKCKREFEWGSSANGWACRWNGDVS